MPETPDPGGTMVQPRKTAKQPRQRGQRRLTTKILVSLVGFLAAFGLAQLAGDNVPDAERAELLWSISASLFVAAIVFIAQFLVDVEQRLDTVEERFGEHATRTGEKLENHARATERQMAEGLSKIHFATELFDLRERSHISPDELESLSTLLQSLTKIASETPQRSMVRMFTLAELSRLARNLQQLGNGSVVSYDGEDRDWLLGLTNAASVSMQATSLSTVDAGGKSFTDGGLWRSELGRKYLNAQALAIERKVTIQRLFVIDSIDSERPTVSDLTEILEPPQNVPARYSLSARAAQGILRRAEKRGRTLPEHLKSALEAVAGRRTPNA